MGLGIPDYESVRGIDLDGVPDPHGDIRELNQLGAYASFLKSRIQGSALTDGVKPILEMEGVELLGRILEIPVLEFDFAYRCLENLAFAVKHLVFISSADDYSTILPEELYSGGVAFDGDSVAAAALP